MLFNYYFIKFFIYNLTKELLENLLLQERNSFNYFIRYDRFVKTDC